MSRYVGRVLLILAVIGTTGTTLWALGFSGHAAVLGMLLAAALTWAPLLLALESMHRLRHPGVYPGSRPPAQGVPSCEHCRTGCTRQGDCG